MSSVSSSGKALLVTHAFLLVVAILVLAFSVQVNQHQDFFFVADLLPFGLSIATLTLFILVTVANLLLFNIFTARAIFQIMLSALLFVFWLASSAFSTSRWRYLPTNCNSIPAEFGEERVWCKNTQILKAFMWVETTAIFITLIFVMRFVLKQRNRGYTGVFSASLFRSKRGQVMSEFLQDGHESDRYRQMWAGYGSTPTPTAGGGIDPFRTSTSADSWLTSGPRPNWQANVHGW